MKRNIMQTDSLKSFTYLENGDISISVFDTIMSSKVLIPGEYELYWEEYPKSQVGLRQLPTSEVLLPLHEFPHRPTIEEMLDKFFNPKIHKVVNDFGMLHKLGILLYGKEGTGKTTIFKHYSRFYIKEKDALVFYIADSERLGHIWPLLKKVRGIQSNPIIIMCDEFDDMIKNQEALVKTILDGYLSIDNCIVLATTNYIDLIPRTIRERPSRLKYVLEIKGVNDPLQIEKIIHVLIGDKKTTEQIKEISTGLKGSTVDAIKQYCLDVIMEITLKPEEERKIGF